MRWAIGVTPYHFRVAVLVVVIIVSRLGPGLGFGLRLDGGGAPPGHPLLRGSVRSIGTLAVTGSVTRACDTFALNFLRFVCVVRTHLLGPGRRGLWLWNVGLPDGLGLLVLLAWLLTTASGSSRFCTS